MSTAGSSAITGGDTDIHILDQEFRQVPTGVVGRIYVRNNTQFDGYTPGTTKDFQDGFMASGEMGYFDDATRLFVVGRDDEMIVSGGENVYQIEVEKTQATQQDVAEVSVVSVEDEKYGRRLVAFVVREPGASASADDLTEHVRENVANYKVPLEITVLHELPRSDTGNIVRSGLRARVGADGR